jgi:hypothetical protein
MSRYLLGQLIFGNHRSGRFRTHVAEKSVVAGSSVHLKIEGITTLVPLAIMTGRLNGGPAEPFGKVIVPFQESLDALIRIPEDAENGPYVFFAQQWEPGGQPGYTGGKGIYPSTVSSVEVRPHIDEEGFWSSFEAWPEEEAEEVRENIRRLRAH